MELLLLVLAMVVLATGGVLARRHHKALAWDRELERAFGTRPDREIPRHRTL